MKNIIFIFFAFVLLTACQNGNSVAPDDKPPEDAQEINELIMKIPDPPEPAPPAEALLSSTSETIIENNTEYGCNIRRFSLTENFEEVVSFNPNADVLWPGSLVQGNSIETGVPALIPLPRKPIKISIDLPVVDNLRTVTEPSSGTVTSAINDLIAKNGIPEIPTPARLSYVEKNAYSLEQSMLKIGVSAKWLTGSIRGNLEIDKSIDKQTIMVRFVQPYYTVAVEPPAFPADAFDSSVTVEQLQSFVGEDNPPAYIASVTYGRMLIFNMSSTHSFDDMKRALKLSVDFLLAGGDVDIDQETRKILSESQLTVVVLGGSAGNGIDLIANKDVLSFLQDEPNVSTEAPGVAISYTIKWLKNHQVAKQGFSTEYEIRECGVNRQNIKVTINKIEVHQDCDPGGRGPGDFYYDFRVVYGGDEKIIAERTREETQAANNGETITIDRWETISLPKTSGSSFRVKGEVRESDGTASDPDEFPGEFDHFFSYDDNEWDPGVKEVLLRQSSQCGVTVLYTIELF